MARITRKQLKQDRFAEEVTQSVEYVSAHRKQLIVWILIAVAAIVGTLGYLGYRRNRATQARGAFQQAMQLFHGKVDTETRLGFVTFPTTIEKYRRATEALEEVNKNFPGSGEDLAARYYLALLEIEQDKSEQAQKRLESVVEQADDEIAALAHLVLAELYGRQNRMEDARKLCQQVMDHPTLLVPKERAQLAWARLLVKTNPDEAKQLLDELMRQPGPVAAAASKILGEIRGS